MQWHIAIQYRLWDEMNSIQTMHSYYSNIEYQSKTITASGLVSRYKNSKL